MKDWRHKYQVLFVTLISLWVLIFPACCLFYSLDKMDVFRSPHWENPVQEDLLIDLQKKWMGSGWLFCPVLFLQGKEVLRLFPDLLLNPLSIENILVLRC